MTEAGSTVVKRDAGAERPPTISLGVLCMTPRRAAERPIITSCDVKEPESPENLRRSARQRAELGSRMTVPKCCSGY